ncbi:MAG TPA: hypothetical protein VNQ79_19645 [Blastocatellia bacterium]|nr:hypothetical protein [Blastocatellia bacterium]
MAAIRPITLADLLEMLRRHRAVMLLATGVVLTATLLVIRQIPDLYESRAMVIIASLRSSEAQMDPAQVAAVTNRLTSRSNLEELIRRHKLFPKAANADDAVEAMSKAVKLDTRLRDFYPQVPEAVTVTFRYPDPRTAEAVMKDLVAGFSQANEEIRKQATDDVTHITARVNEVENRLAELSRQHAASLRASGVRRKTDDSALRAMVLAQTSSLETLTDRQDALTQQIAQQKRLIAEQEKRVRVTTPDNGCPTAACGILQTRRAELEAQIREYLKSMTEKNPKVVQARSQLAEINLQLDQAEKKYAAAGTVISSPEERDLRVMQQELAKMEAELNATRNAIERKRQNLASLPAVPLVPMTETTEAPRDFGFPMTQEQSALLNHLLDLSKRRDDLQKRLATLALFQLTDPPTVSRLPVAPKRLRLYLMALAAAIVPGLLAGAAIEAPRLLLIRSQRDVDFYLGVPVMALLPPQPTPVEHRRLRRLRMMRTCGALLLACALAPALAVILNLTGILQLLANR